MNAYLPQELSKLISVASIFNNTKLNTFTEMIPEHGIFVILFLIIIIVFSTVLIFKGANDIFYKISPL